MRETVIAGVGISKFGHFPDVPFYTYTTQVVLDALEDAGVDWKDVQACFSGSEEQGTGSGHQALRELGLTGLPIVNVENACASGASAFRLAYKAVASGEYDTVLALGFEKMPRGAIPSTAFYDFQLKMGMNFQPANYALETLEYMEETGTTVDDISRVVLKNRAGGALNPIARFTKEVTLEEINHSKPVCHPFRLLHCSATSDGAVAIIVTTRQKAGTPSRSVNVKSSTLASGVYGLAGYQNGVLPSVVNTPKEDYTEISSRRAYEEAGAGPEDIDVLQAYDSMAAGEIWDLEKLGFCKKGEAAGLLRDGYFDLGGKKPSNTDGGIMGRGHAIGASGAAQIYEIVAQLRGEAGPRQVSGARLGLAHALGAGPNSCITILEKA